MNDRGGVILHILVTGILVALIASLLLRMTLLSHLLVVRSQGSTEMQRANEGSLARVISYWNENGLCSQPPDYNLIGGPAGTCFCVLTPNVAPTNRGLIVANLNGAACEVVVTSLDP